MAHKKNDLQSIVDRFAEASRPVELTISLEKTEVLVQAAPNTIRPQPNITIEGVQLKCVESFKYLGSTTSADGSLDSKISSRMNEESQALGRLKAKVLQQKGIRLSTKIKVYKTVVVSTLYSVVVKLGPDIAGTSNSWNSFTQGHYA